MLLFLPNVLVYFVQFEYIFKFTFSCLLLSTKCWAEGVNNFIKSFYIIGEDRAADSAGSKGTDGISVKEVTILLQRQSS